jgi:hypothetical protein
MWTELDLQLEEDLLRSQEEEAFLEYLKELERSLILCNEG